MSAAIDTSMFRIINCSWSNPAFDIIMPLVTELGSGEALFLISVLLFVLRRKTDKGMSTILLCAGLAAAYYIVYFLKGIIGRPRPFVMMPDAHLFVFEKSFSFPSTHAAQAFMAATVLSGFFKSWRVPLFFIAVLVCYSRVYLGVHFPFDVAAGAVLGALIGYGLLRIAGSMGRDA